MKYRLHFTWVTIEVPENDVISSGPSSIISEPELYRRSDGSLETITFYFETDRVKKVQWWAPIDTLSVFFPDRDDEYDMRDVRAGIEALAQAKARMEELVFQ